MSTEDFFSSVSKNMVGSYFEVVIMILIITSIFSYYFYIKIFKPWYRTRKKTKEFYDFLKLRHNLSDWEWDAVLSGIKKSGVKPSYIPLISSEVFSEIRDYIGYELNNDQFLDNIEYKLFNR
jgi:hypothetical protein